mmetsp:Transcript_17475/g.48725  ORF Transcript_17475/g.48725 Transcript_17475/m.48725 type:complete len:88 (-) Transcript_17475:2452-2715(-)
MRAVRLNVTAPSASWVAAKTPQVLFVRMSALSSEQTPRGIAAGTPACSCIIREGKQPLGNTKHKIPSVFHNISLAPVDGALGENLFE